ncbi:MAG: HlyD family efflux transporter periplasmic adaptor subunit [Pseudomonadota bacterium]
MRFLRRSLTGLFLLSATIGLLAFGVGQIRDAAVALSEDNGRSFTPRERSFAVNVVTFEPGQVVPVLDAFGEISSRRSLDLRPEVAGQVVELAENFVDGGRVEEGQILMQIDSANAESALALAWAELREAEAEVLEAERAVLLSRDELAASQDTASLQERALSRQSGLVERGVGTEASLEAAEIATYSARQSVLSRRLALQQAEQRVTTMQARVERAQINLTEAERDLENTTIVASFSGVLSDVSIVEGGIVGQNERVATLIDDRALEVMARVSTEQYARLIDDTGALRPAEVAVTLDVFGADITTTGALSRVSASVGEGLTGRQLFVTLEDAPGFRPGDFVSVAIEEPPVWGVARLPATALSASNRVLMLGDENRLEEVEVQLVRRQGDDVLVRSRDIAGRSVVAERSPLLGQGILVNPIAPEGAAAQMAAAPTTIQLDEERRARLISFIEGNNRMPAAAKERVLAQLKQDEVPITVVERIEGRMGG